MPRPARRWLTVASVALLTAGLLALYLSQRHTGLFENGSELMELWRRGVLVHTHALLLPLARLAAWLGLAGSPAVPDRAVSLVSCVGAALAVAVVVARAAGWTGTREALLAGLLLGLAPALRFYAGAVETRALGCGCAAVAGALAGYAAPTRARALAWTAAGYAIACAGHVSLIVLGPALLLLHADAERRAGRPVTLARLAGAAVALLSAALAMGAALYAADQLFNPALPNSHSSMLYYFLASSGWSVELGRPSPPTWIMSEILGPFDALVPFALVGVRPLLRRAPWRGAALIVWVVLVGITSYGVGSRQFGGYFLAALPALAWLAAEGLRHLALAQPGRAALASVALPLLVLLALLALPAALAAWHARGVDSVFGSAPYRLWLVQRADLALPGPWFPGRVAEQIHPLVWLTIGAFAALLAGAVRGADTGVREPQSAWRRRGPVCVLLAVALGLQIAGGETFRLRWPIHWSQQTRDYCEALRAQLGPHDRLFTAIPSTAVAWQFNYYLGDRWTDLGHETYLPPAQRPAWLADVEAELARVHAAGGTAYLGKIGLALLEERRDTSPMALAAAKRWLADGLVVLWKPE